jgi:hypothetical protein
MLSALSGAIVMYAVTLSTTGVCTKTGAMAGLITVAPTGLRGRALVCL